MLGRNAAVGVLPDDLGIVTLKGRDPAADETGDAPPEVAHGFHVLQTGKIVEAVGLSLLASDLAIFITSS